MYCDLQQMKATFADRKDRPSVGYIKYKAKALQDKKEHDKLRRGCTFMILPEWFIKTREEWDKSRK